MPLGSIPDDVIEDWHKVREALAGTRPGADHIGLASLGDRERFFLVPMQAEFRPEEARRFLSNDFLRRELAERRPGLVCGVELEDRRRPKLSGRHPLVNESVYAFVEDVDEALEVLAVLLGDPVTETENVQAETPCGRPCSDGVASACRVFKSRSPTSSLTRAAAEIVNRVSPRASAWKPWSSSISRHP